MLRALRDTADVIVSIDGIGRQLRPDDGAEDRPWMESVVASLERDGPVLRGRAVERRVGEGRAEYRVDTGVSQEDGDMIGLP